MRGGCEGARLLLAGQLLSVIITGTGVCSQALSNHGVDASLVMVLVTYIAVVLVHAPIHLYSLLTRRRTRGGSRTQPQTSCAGEQTSLVEVPGQLTTPAVAGLLLLNALADVQGNVLVVTAYQYTSISRVMVLDCFTIPCVILISRVWLGVRFGRWHVAGVALCLGGLAIIISHDLRDVLNGNASGTLKGDVLCLIGASAYAVSNCVQERIVTSGWADSSSQYLTFLGVPCILLCCAQLLIMGEFGIKGELDKTTVGLIGGFVGCMLAMYSLVPRFLVVSTATFLNLSLLTSDVYAVVLDTFLFSEKLDLHYFAGFALVLVGLVVYHVKGDTPVPP